MEARDLVVVHGERRGVDRMAVEDAVDVGAGGEDVAVEAPFRGRAPGPLVGAVEVHLHEVVRLHPVVGQRVGVTRKPAALRTDRLPAVPWLMPLSFMRRQVATISSRRASSVRVVMRLGLRRWGRVALRGTGRLDFGKAVHLRRSPRQRNAPAARFVRCRTHLARSSSSQPTNASKSPSQPREVRSPDRTDDVGIAPATMRRFDLYQSWPSPGTSIHRRRDPDRRPTVPPPLRPPKPPH